MIAAVDAENGVVESNERNNKGSSSLIVPDILLLPGPVSPSFSVGDPISVDISAYNLTTRSHAGFILDTVIRDPHGNIVSSETSPLPEIAEGTMKMISLPAKMTNPSIGIYSVAGRISKERQIAAVSTSFTIKPTLLLTGSLEETASTAVLCRPFTLHSGVANRGNIAPSSGTIGFEFVPPTGDGKPLYSKKFPYGPGLKSYVIDSVDLPAGSYTLRMTASLSNDKHAISREFVLAEQPVKIAGPVEVQKVKTLFPRILLWLGREGRVVEQAVSENIVKQAFEQENLYYKVVDSEDTFRALAMSGIFNTYVLLEPQEMPEADWLKERIERGHGVVIIGSGEISRALAEKFEFSLEELSAKQPPSMITFRDGADTGLSGTMPLSGKAFSPGKQGAKPAAFYSPSDLPAALLDHSGKGKLLLMPLSLSRSAYQGGTPALYGMVLRRMVLSAAPNGDEPDGAVCGGFLVSSAQGPVKAVIKKTLAAGDRVLWTNADGVVKQNSLSYEMTAVKEPRSLLYLYQPSAVGSGGEVEAFFECNGKLLSQGKVE
jgi:hypothetical protein